MRVATAVSDLTLRVRSLTACAAVANAISLVFYNGHLHPASLLFTTLGFAAAVRAIYLDQGGQRIRTATGPERWIPRDPSFILWVGILASLGLDLVLSPGYETTLAGRLAFLPLALAACLLGLSYKHRSVPRLLQRVRFPLWLGLAVAMAGLVIVAAPRPYIDVWHFEMLGTKSLLRGQNPYALEYPNIYGPDTKFYGRLVLTNDGLRFLGYPYFPLTIYLFVPSFLMTGEVRWTLLACVIFSAWALWRLGKRGRAAELAAVFLLVQPRAFFLLERSWTEPMILAAVLLTLLAAVRWIDREEAEGPSTAPLTRDWIATGLAAALLLAVKQYTALVALPLLLALPKQGRWKAAALAISGAAVLTLPVAFWDVHAFVNSVVLQQVRQPFRADSLSWPAAVAWLGGPQLPHWIAGLAGAAILVATLRWQLSLSRAMTIAAAVLAATHLMNGRQAFCNYYWLVGALLCTATVLQARSSTLEEIEAERSAGQRTATEADPNWAEVVSRGAERS